MGRPIERPGPRIIACVGPNGAGKTTTIEICEGLLTADSGRVEVLGRNWESDGRDLRELLGIQLQDTQLSEKLTVDETLTLFQSFYRDARDVGEVIDKVELGEKRYSRVGALSGGQKQRLAVACALVGNPQLLFLDEPTTGLDPQARHKMWEVIEQLHARGKTILLTTHYMEEAERLCDRVAIMDHGKIIALDQPHALVRQYFKEQAIEFQTKQLPSNGALEHIAGVTTVQHNEHAITCYSSDVPTTMAGLLALAQSGTLTFDDLTVRRATLEDVFLKLTGRRIRE